MAATSKFTAFKQRSWSITKSILGLGNDRLSIEIPGVSCLTFYVKLWPRPGKNKGGSRTASTCKDVHAPFNVVGGSFEWLYMVHPCLCECKQAMMGTWGVVSFSLDA